MTDSANSTAPASPLATPRATREVLERFGHAANKSLGQNFLVNDGVVRRIIELSQPQPDQLVLEVGPGIGTLTLALLANSAGVVAIERDASLVEVLAHTTDEDPCFELIQADAVQVASEQVEQAANAIAKRTGREPGLPTMLVANLPYAVAATVIAGFLERFDFLQSATVMVQKEVADRIAAKPGTKQYGAYTVLLSLLAQVTGRFEVGPGNFMPAPHVDSAVIRLDRAPVFMPDGSPATKLQRRAAALAAKAAFAQRRKTIRNSMRAHLASVGAGVGEEALLAALEQAGIAPTVRGETLAVSDFLLLGQALVDAGASM